MDLWNLIQNEALCVPYLLLHIILFFTSLPVIFMLYYYIVLALWSCVYDCHKYIVCALCLCVFDMCSLVVWDTNLEPKILGSIPHKSNTVITYFYLFLALKTPFRTVYTALYVYIPTYWVQSTCAAAECWDVLEVQCCVLWNSLSGCFSPSLIPSSSPSGKSPADHLESPQ